MQFLTTIGIGRHHQNIGKIGNIVAYALALYSYYIRTVVTKRCDHEAHFTYMIVIVC